MDQQQLKELIALASYAPSVHNTQPWNFRFADNRLELSVCTSRVLQKGDPIQRELWISMGCCIGTTSYALKALGFEFEVTRQANDPEKPVAVFALGPRNAEKDESKIQNILRRQSYRGKLLPDINNDLEAAIDRARMVFDNGVSVEVVRQKSATRLIADLTMRGMSMALHDPDFRRELAELVHLRGSTAPVGMNGESLEKTYLASVWEKISLNTGLQNGKKAALDGNRISESGAVVCLFSSGDMPDYWLRVGVAYANLSLELTASNIVSSTFAATAEAGDFHEEVEKICRTSDRLQTVMRVGIPVSKDDTIFSSRRSCRLPVSELLQN